MLQLRQSLCFHQLSTRRRQRSHESVPRETNTASVRAPSPRKIFFSFSSVSSRVAVCKRTKRAKLTCWCWRGWCWTLDKSQICPILQLWRPDWGSPGCASWLWAAEVLEDEYFNYSWDPKVSKLYPILSACNLGKKWCTINNFHLMEWGNHENKKSWV